MSHRTDRREFLKQTTLAGAGVWLGTTSAFAQTKSPNEKLNVGVIGVGGRGASNLRGMEGENVVALCDVDEQTLGKAAAAFPKAKQYHDFRKLLEQKDLDAVVVSTPDHVHAFATVGAMQLGKHVYCEKPLTRTVHEARAVAAAAKKYKVATQMGNQGHSNDSTRRVVEILQSGAIGSIKEVHAWTNRPIWPQGIQRPTEIFRAPGHLHWDLWLGPAKERPYHPAYAPFKWRGWWDFGTGALGDMACHIMDCAFWGLKLGQPVSVEAWGPAPDPDSAPAWEIIRYEFPAREGLAPVRLTWYDGNVMPSVGLFEGYLPQDNGSLFIGEKGKLCATTYGEKFALLPEKNFKEFQAPAASIPSSPGHYAEWFAACKTGSPTGSNFEYATALTAMVLLGNVAYRTGKKLQWNGDTMTAVNCPEAEPLLKPDYRRGWSL